MAGKTGTLVVKITGDAIAPGDWVKISVKNVTSKADTVKAKKAGVISKSYSNVESGRSYEVKIHENEADGWVADKHSQKVELASGQASATAEFSAISLVAVSANRDLRDDELEVQMTKQVMAFCTSGIDHWLAAGESIDDIQKKILKQVAALAA